MKSSKELFETFAEKEIENIRLELNRKFSYQHQTPKQEAESFVYVELIQNLDINNKYEEYTKSVSELIHLRCAQAELRDIERHARKQLSDAQTSQSLPTIENAYWQALEIVENAGEHLEKHGLEKQSPTYKKLIAPFNETSKRIRSELIYVQIRQTIEHPTYSPRLIIPPKKFLQLVAERAPNRADIVFRTAIKYIK